MTDHADTAIERGSALIDRNTELFLANERIKKLEYALRIIALQAHEVVLDEPVDWRDVANTFVGVARNALE